MDVSVIGGEPRRHRAIGRRLAAVGLVVASLTGLGAVAMPALTQASSPPVVHIQPTPPTTTPATSTTLPARLPSTPVPRYANPVTTFDTPDPYLTQLGPHSFELEVTGANLAGTFPMYHTTDLVHYQPDGAIFTAQTTPGWATDSFWAPEIHPVGDKFVAYFTARDDSGVLRIGAAVSDSIHGPYRDIGHPLVSNPHLGVIDPTMFKGSDGKQYLYWKEDGNGAQPQQPTRIMVSQLSADGVNLLGPATEVQENQARFGDGDVLEAPEVVQHGNYIYLLDAHGDYASSGYGEVVSRSLSPTGPFERDPTPLLQSGDNTLQGPGHASAPVTVGDTSYLLYAGWYPGHVGQAPGRVDGLDRLTWGTDQWPHVANGVPSTLPQAVP